jgi:hypothetical protein
LAVHAQSPPRIAAALLAWAWGGPVIATVVARLDPTFASFHPASQLPSVVALRRPLEFGQYLSIRYTERLADEGAVTSVGSEGESYDNVLAETVDGLSKSIAVTSSGICLVEIGICQCFNQLSTADRTTCNAHKIRCGRRATRNASLAVVQIVSARFRIRPTCSISK